MPKFAYYLIYFTHITKSDGMKVSKNCNFVLFPLHICSYIYIFKWHDFMEVPYLERKLKSCNYVFILVLEHLVFLIENFAFLNFSVSMQI